MSKQGTQKEKASAQKRKISEDESERAPTRQQPKRLAKPGSFLAEATSDLTISSRYELKDLPSIASTFTEEDIEALNATFEPVSDENDVIPNVEVLEFPNSYLLPNIDRDILEKKKFDVDKLAISDGYIKTFIKYLHRVVMNAGLDIGTEESKTDSLVNYLLTRVCEFDRWPFGVRIKERYKLNVSNKNVTANPDFVVDMKEIAIIVTEDKHLKNVDAPDFGEAQILAEILACGYENSRISRKISDQNIFAIRVISSYVTFYKVEVPVAYWKELKRGLPQDQSIRILRWPQENSTDSGLDMAEPDGRQAILEAITKIRQFLLQPSSSHTDTSPAEQSSKTKETKGKNRELY